MCLSINRDLMTDIVIYKNVRGGCPVGVSVGVLGGGGGVGLDREDRHRERISIYTGISRSPAPLWCVRDCSKIRKERSPRCISLAVYGSYQEGIPPHK